LHLYILRGDITKLHCDAWLLPTDRRLNLMANWRPHVPAEVPPPPADWAVDGCRSYAWPGWDGPPVPWLTWVGQRQEVPDPEFYVEAARQFVTRAAPGARLLALPLVGAGSGGGASIKGGLAERMVNMLLDLEVDADVALVCWEESQFAACQQVRNRRPNWSLPAGLNEQAQRLASLAKSDRLALFLGAGVSRGAGLPDWNSLLQALAEGCGVDFEELARLDALDKAQLLARRYGKDFKAQVAERLKAPRYSLSHGLLASLPARETITQNYDQLFERASEAAGHVLSVIPYAPEPAATRWLLKMHGCLSHPEEIVLTRGDFLSYSRWRAALAGMVQALLLTRHMLFVGFSLTDYNFHWIVDEVRQARKGAERFGSALLLEAEGAFRELWEDDLDLISLGDGRTLQIFLDCVLARASDTSRHLLDVSFDQLLGTPERWLRDRLRDLAEGADAEVQALPAWAMVRDLLHRLGG